MIRVVFLALVLVSAWPCKANAADFCGKAVSLIGGTKAPCTGVLLPQLWALSCTECREVLLPRCENDAKLARSLHLAETTALTEQLDSLRSFSAAQTKLLEEALDQDSAWYQSPYLWTAVGAALGVGLTIGVVYAVDRP